MQSDDLAYLIHIKPFKESSAIVRLLSAEHGLFSAVIRGVYKKDKRAAALRAALQMGNLLEISFKSRLGLKTLYQVDAIQQFPSLTMPLFLSCSYINELNLRLLQEDMPQNDVFILYQRLFNDIAVIVNTPDERTQLQALLRCYEFDFLECLGFAFDFSVDIDQQQVQAQNFYKIIAGAGIQLDNSASNQAFSGALLLDIAQRSFAHEERLIEVKRISRYLLNFYLDGRPLKARELYAQMLNE